MDNLWFGVRVSVVGTARRCGAAVEIVRHPFTTVRNAEAVTLSQSVQPNRSGPLHQVRCGPKLHAGTGSKLYTRGALDRQALRCLDPYIPGGRGEDEVVPDLGKSH